MYPYHHHWHRGPSRILWFFIGAASATFWIKRKDMHNEGHFSRCFRAPIQQPPPASAPAWSARDIPGAINNIPPAEPVPWALGHQKSASSREEERILELTRQAGDAVRLARDTTTSLNTDTLEDDRIFRGNT